MTHRGLRPAAGQAGVRAAQRVRGHSVGQELLSLLGSLRVRALHRTGEAVADPVPRSCRPRSASGTSAASIPSGGRALPSSPRARPRADTWSARRPASRVRLGLGDAPATACEVEIASVGRNHFTDTRASKTEKGEKRAPADSLMGRSARLPFTRGVEQVDHHVRLEERARGLALAHSASASTGRVGSKKPILDRVVEDLGEKPSTMLTDRADKPRPTSFCRNSSTRFGSMSAVGSRARSAST